MQHVIFVVEKVIWQQLATTNGTTTASVHFVEILSMVCLSVQRPKMQKTLIGIM